MLYFDKVIANSSEQLRYIGFNSGSDDSMKIYWNLKKKH